MFSVQRFVDIILLHEVFMQNLRLLPQKKNFAKVFSFKEDGVKFAFAFAFANGICLDNTKVFLSKVSHYYRAKDMYTLVGRGSRPSRWWWVHQPVVQVLLGCSPVSEW